METMQRGGGHALPRCSVARGVGVAIVFRSCGGPAVALRWLRWLRCAGPWPTGRRGYRFCCGGYSADPPPLFHCPWFPPSYPLGVFPQRWPLVDRGRDRRGTRMGGRDWTSTPNGFDANRGWGGEGGFIAHPAITVGSHFQPRKDWRRCHHHAGAGARACVCVCEREGRARHGGQSPAC